MEIGSEPDAERLVGRAEQYRELVHLLEEGRSGAVVLGASGVGKTLLVRAACRALAGRFRCVHVRGSAASAKTPYGALGWLLTELPETATASPLLMLPRLHAHLKNRAGERELLFVVDNADLLDPASASLIGQLVRGFSVRVVATAETLAARRASEFVSLWSDGLIGRIDLESLNRDQTAELMEQLLDGRVSARAAASMWTESGGNPHYITLLTREQRDAGTLVLRDGTWVLAAPFVHNGEIAELMAARLGRLSADERKLVEVLAFMVVLPLDVVLRLVPPCAVEVLEDRRTIETVGTRMPSARISLAATGSLVAAAVPPGRSCELWEEVTALVRPSDLEAPAVAAYAAWTLRCGATLSPELALSAARLENAAGNPAGALRYVRLLRPADRTREAVVEEVQALTQLGRISAAAKTVEAYLARPGGQPCPEDDASRLELLLMQARLEQAMDQDAAALRTLEKAAAGPDLPAAARARIDLFRAVLAIDGGSAPAADRQRLADIAGDEALPERVRFAALAVGAELHAALGDGEEAGRWFSGARALLRRGLPASWQDSGHSRLFHAALLMGDLSAASALNWDHLAVPPLQATYRGSAGEIARGLAALLGGRIDDAADLLSSAVSQLVHRDPDDHLPLARAGLACALAFQGDVERAAATAREAGPFKYRHSWALEQLRTFLLLLVGYPAGTLAGPGEVLELARQARDRGHRAMALLQLGAAAALFPGREDLLKDLGATAADATGPWAGVLLDLAEGWQAADAPRLIGAARTAMQLHQFAAAFTAARAAQRVLGPTRTGPAQEARSLESAAHRVLRRTHAIEHRFSQLTAFEQDLARKAAGPLSRMDISSALHLSPRTVDWHLGKIFAKLDVSGRRELREQLELAEDGRP